MKELICLTPYRELRHGGESMFNHLGKRREVSLRIKQYLSLGVRQSFVQGIYLHPFTGKELVGPVLMGDGERFTWDRDTLEYVEEYGLELPREFVEFVESAEGFLALCRMRRLA